MFAKSRNVSLKAKPDARPRLKIASLKIDSTTLGLSLLLLVVNIGFSLAMPGRFFSDATFMSVAFQLPELGLLTLAMFIPILSGGLNLCIIATANLTSLLMAWVFLTWLPPDASMAMQAVWLSLPFISALDNQPVAAMLSQRLHLPVAMDKDVNHLMWWDLTRHSAMPDVAVGLYLGTGLGNSLWINGDFYHGAHGGAGELGHIPLAGNPLLCPCGKTGSVETLTSGNWLTGWARQHAPQTPFADLFVRHAGHVDLTEFVARLARTVASEMNILDPEYLVLGGGVLAMENFPLVELEQQLRSHLRSPYPANGLTIHFSAVTDEAGCRGACLAAQRVFPSQPALAAGTFSFRREA